jgi:hypothetical protein
MIPREGETERQANLRYRWALRLETLANDAERDGVILELRRVPREGSPLAQGNHEPQVIAYTNHRL